MKTTTQRLLYDPATNLPDLADIAIPVLPQITTGRIINSRKPAVLFLLLLAIWFIPPTWLHRIDPTAATIDQSIWLMVDLSLITFLMIIAVCWWLLKLYWQMLGLPPISLMVLNFKLSPLCHQLAFYLISFALLLLTALGCLIAIC